MRENPTSTPIKKTYIDLFAGCGGLSLGLNQSGWQGLFAVEKSPFAFATLKHNLIDILDHFNWPSWMPVQEHDINEILQAKHKELHQLRGTVDLVAGGPPCQGFSSAGKREESDKRNSLIRSYIKFIRLVQPKILFFENVKGFTQKFEKNASKGIRYSEFVENSLRRSGRDFKGYEVYGKLIDFSEYGIPQKRTRFILVGVRKDIFRDQGLGPQRFFEKARDSRIKFLINKGIGPNINLQEAISDLLTNNGLIDCPDSVGFKSAVYCQTEYPYQNLMRKLNPDVNVPNSHRLAKHSPNTIELFETLLASATKGKKISNIERQLFGVKKRGIVILDGAKPAPTLTSHPDDYVHYCEPRILSVREYARIQTFPDWYEFKKKYTTGGHLRIQEVPRYTQIGNAIPPLFAEQVGEILKQFV